MPTRILFCLVFAVPPTFAKGELLILEKAPDSVFATGASFNAIAGGLSAGDFDVDESTPTSLPDADLLSAAFAASAASADHMFTLSPDFSLGPAVFESEFSGFTRSAVEDQRATAEGHIEFKVDMPAKFSLDGFFEVDDLAGSSGTVELEAHLFDISAGAAFPTPVFSSYQKSTSTSDQAFTIGGLAGDETNALLGSPTGMLDPSKHYALKFLVNSLALDTTTGPATASGKITFAVSSVPEPGAAAGLPLAFVLIARRQRRSLPSLTRSKSESTEAR